MRTRGDVWVWVWVCVLIVVVVGHGHGVGGMERRGGKGGRGMRKETDGLLEWRLGIRCSGAMGEVGVGIFTLVRLLTCSLARITIIKPWPLSLFSPARDQITGFWTRTFGHNIRDPWKIGVFVEMVEE